MPGFIPPSANASAIPSADVRATTDEPPKELIVHQAFPVRRTEADLKDFLVPLRATVLSRCRRRLVHIATASFPWHEVTLGLSTLALGAYMGALTTPVEADSAKAFFLRTLMPLVGVGTGVAYFFMRKRAAREAAIEAEEVLADLPDPDKTQ